MRIDDSTLFKVHGQVIGPDEWKPIRAQLSERLWWQGVEDGSITTGDAYEESVHSRDVDAALVKYFEDLELCCHPVGMPWVDVPDPFEE